MAWYVTCDGMKGLGNLECRDRVLCGERAKIPPAVGWTLVMARDGATHHLCHRCSDAHYRRLMATPAEEVAK